MSRLRDEASGLLVLLDGAWFLQRANVPQDDVDADVVEDYIHRGYAGARWIPNRIAAESLALLSVLDRVVRMEGGDFRPGDRVEHQDGFNTWWSGEIVRENRFTYTVTRMDGATRRWDKDAVHPTRDVWDDARAAIARAKGEDR